MFMIIGAIVGCVLGLGTTNIMALIAKNGPKHYDIIRFTRQASILANLDDWARRHGYVLKEDDGVSRRYQKGRNILTSPIMLEAAQHGDQVTIKAYIQINGFILKGDMPLSGGGFMAKVPRGMGKKALNELLREFGQQELA